MINVEEFVNHLNLIISTWLMFQKAMIALCLILAVTSQTLMLTAKQDFIKTVTKTNIAVYFYGTQDTQQYGAFENILPSDKELFSGLEFYFIPSDEIKISKKKHPALLIFRNIPGNQWITYDGPLNTAMMSEWVRHNCFDALPDISGEQIDELFVEKRKGFILLDFGQFDLLAAKIALNDYCKEHNLLCGKCTIKNMALRMVVQLMRAQNEPGVPKLAFWDPATQKFTLFSKKPVCQLGRQDIIEIVQGRQGLVQSSVTPTPMEDLLEEIGDEEPVSNDDL